MPFNVLRCYQCNTFQIHPQTKASKWRCKMCNEKQSFLKVYMTGTAPDCRQTVQKLNMRQGEMANSLELETTRNLFISQATDTHLGFCSAAVEQTDETNTAVCSELLPSPSSVYCQQWNNPSHTEYLNTSGKCVNRISRPETHPGRKPLLSQAASNSQGDGLGQSKWSKYLDLGDLVDSSSEDDDTSATTFRHPKVHSQHHGILSLHSGQQSFQMSATLDDKSSEEENLPY